jgi:uncharacterized protein YybS (DUF2232 family)
MKGQAALLTAVAIGVTLLCLLGANWLGPVGAMLNLLTPIAAAYLSMRYGLQTGVVVVTVVSLLILQLAPLSILAAYIGLFAVGSLLLPLLLQRRLPWDKAVLFTALGSTLVALAMAIGTMLTDGIQFDRLIAQLLQSEVDQAIQIYRDSGFSAAQLQEMQGIVDGIADFIRQTFYGLYLSGVLAIQFLCLAVLQRLKKTHYQIEGIAFDRWRLPVFLVWVLIIAGFAMLVPQPHVMLIGRNLLAVLLPLYFLQGLSVVNCFLKRKTYPPVLKGMIYLMVFILNPLPLIITGVGVFDLWVDFRRPRKKDIK